MIVKRFLTVGALALLAASCNNTFTQGISESRAEAPIRRFCPAFRNGSFAADMSRSYGAEQITTFRNETSFHCRCIAKTADEAPVCSQVRRFSLGRVEEG
jgi:hypothetical protein